MKTTKIKLKKPIYFLKRVFDKYSDWRVYKTRPTRSGEQDVVYKVTQKTIVTINKNEIIDIINADIQGYETSGSTVNIYNGGISEWLRSKGIEAQTDPSDSYCRSYLDYDQTNNEEYGYKLNRTATFKQGVEALSDDYELSEVTVLIDEDATVVPFNKADNEVVNKIKNTDAKKQLFDAFIKDAIQPILEKHGMGLYGRYVSFKSYNDLVSFIHEALQDKLNKEFNQIGLNINECASISKRSPSSLFYGEPMFGFENIDVLGQDSTNK